MGQGEAARVAVARVAVMVAVWRVEVVRAVAARVVVMVAVARAEAKEVVEWERPQADSHSPLTRSPQSHQDRQTGRLPL